MQFICYAKCSTCKKARKWLEEQGLAFQEREIKTEKPTYEELKQWLNMSGLPVKRFFNTSGLLYQSMNLKEKLAQLSEDEQLRLLASDGMLVKRPLLVAEDKVLVGFKEAEWSEKLGLTGGEKNDDRK